MGLNKKIIYFIIAEILCSQQIFGKTMKSQCQENPDLRFAQTRVQENDKANLIDGDYRINPIRLNIPTQSYLENDYFKIVRGESDKAVPSSCLDIRATNIFYHMNYAMNWIATNPDIDDVFFKELHFPLIVRVDMDKEWSFFDKFGKKEKFNNALTSYTYFSSHGQSLVQEEEIWFFKGRRGEKRYSFLPICFLGLFTNTGVCEKTTMLDTAMFPSAIYHELIHVLTNQFLSRGHEHLLDEAYAHALSGIIERVSIIGKNVSRKYIPAGLEVRLTNQTLKRPDQPDNVKIRNYVIQLIYRSYLRLIETGIERKKAFGIILNSTHSIYEHFTVPPNDDMTASYDFVIHAIQESCRDQINNQCPDLIKEFQNVL